MLFQSFFPLEQQGGVKKKKKPSARVSLENPYYLLILSYHGKSCSSGVLCDVAAPGPEAGEFLGLTTGQLREGPAQEVWGPAGPLSQRRGKIRGLSPADVQGAIWEALRPLKAGAVRT